MSCLEAIALSSSTEWNKDSRTDAQSLLLALTQFIVALEASHNLLAYTRGLSVKLQGPYVDVSYAYNEIESVKSVLRGSRSSVDSFHSIIYSTVLHLLVQTTSSKQTAF